MNFPAIRFTLLFLLVYVLSEVATFESAVGQQYRTPGQQPEIQYSTRATGKQPYFLDSGDVLGVFLEGVLGKVGSMPPIHYPPAGSSLGPSMGYPIVVRENGKVSLPLVDSISVRGLTVMQAEERIKSAYLGNNKTGEKILRENSRILVSLQRKRTVNVIVIRQDNGSSMGVNRGIIQRGPVNSRSDLSSRSSTVRLPADQSNLFHALLESGGLPGLNAKPEARVYRSQSNSVADLQYQNSFPRSNTRGYSSTQGYGGGMNYRVPLETNGTSFGAQRTALSDGDVVVVESRPTEVYYTSGLIRSAEHPFPRDRSMNVLEAVALAGGPVTATRGRFGISQLPPTELNIIRTHPQYGHQNLRVDLNQAIVDPSQRLLVMPGDHLILRYKPGETVGNIGIGVLNTYGLRRAFN